MGVHYRMGSRALLATALGLAALAGCGDSGYDYVANKSEKVYFKLPEDWTVFGNRDLVEEPELSRAWITGFVGESEATVEGVFSLTSEVPRGYVEILELIGDEREELSLTTLRAANLPNDLDGNPIDPLAFAQENPEGPITILGYDEVVLDHGAHGVHLRVAIVEPGFDAIIDQTVLVDPATTKRYVLSIGCAVECFESNEKQIEEVIESWTLEKT